MRLLAAGTALFLLAGVAHGEFSPEEKAEVVEQFESMKNVLNAMSWATRHAVNHRADAVAVSTFVGDAAVAWKAHQMAVLYLLDQRGDEDQIFAESFLAGPREDVVALALQRIQSPGYSFARNRLDQVAGSSSDLDTAITLMDLAIGQRAGIDASLAYEEPRMAVNLATPGATRRKSAAIGPRGDYRAVGYAANTWIRAHAEEWVHTARGFATCPAWLDLSKGPAFHTGHLTLTGRNLNVVVGLAAGIEWPVLITGTGRTPGQNVDIMEAGGTTARPREFFDIQLALEIMLMWTHTGYEAADVNGRFTARGLTYDLTVLGNDWGLAAALAPELCGTPEDLAAFLDAMGDGMAATANVWGALDNLAYHGLLILKFFQVFPPPGPSDPPPDPDPDPPPAPTELIIDNTDPNAVMIGGWSPSTGTGPWGTGSAYCAAACTFRWNAPSLPAGPYEVFVWYTGSTQRITNAPYVVNTPSGIQTVLVNQQANASQWFSIGVFSLDETAYVELSTINGPVNADAVRFVSQ